MSTNRWMSLLPAGIGTVGFALLIGPLVHLALPVFTINLPSQTFVEETL